MIYDIIFLDFTPLRTWTTDNHPYTVDMMANRTSNNHSINPNRSASNEPDITVVRGQLMETLIGNSILNLTNCGKKY